MDKVTVPGKSTLQRYETWLPDEQMRPLIEQLLCQGRDQALGLQLAEPLDLETAFLDCTCVTTDIHFPVDWVLLRYATRRPRPSACNALSPWTWRPLFSTAPASRPTSISRWTGCSCATRRARSCKLCT